MHLGLRASDDLSEDEFIPSSVGKSKNGHSTSNSKKDGIKKSEEKKPPAEKLKPVSADDFFAASANKLPKLPKIPKIEKKGSQCFFFSGLLYIVSLRKG